MYLFNNKIQTLSILTNYLKKINTNELGYYLDNYKNIQIPTFLESNIYGLEDIEQLSLVIQYFEVLLENLFDKKFLFEIKNIPIKLSFISDSIYWDNIFTIEDTIFIKYQYLSDVFEKIEHNDYKSTNDLFFYLDGIYDLGLIKKLAESICYVLQFLNLNSWEKIIFDKYCYMVDKSKINFANKYNIIKEPNTSFIDDKIIIYKDLNNCIYTVINITNSNLSFAPYLEKKIIKLCYSDGEYFEIDNEYKNIDKYNNEHNIFMEFIEKYSNPFVIKTKQMVECFNKKN